MLKTIAIIFGIVMLAIGILGFVPQALVGNDLFGLFRIDFIHNLVHIATGIVALLCGLNSEYASRTFFQIFGIVYGLVALAGFYYQDRPLFGIMANNIHDAWLHAIIAILSIYLGFFYKDRYLYSDR